MWLLLAISVVVRAAGVLRPQARVAPDSGSCRTDVRVEGTGPSSEFAVTETADGLLIPVQVAGRPDTLWLLFDSGAGHTVLDRNVARRLDLRATSQGTISGVGTGATAVDIVSRVALSLPGVRIEHVDLRLAAIPGPTHSRRPYTDGIIGYDLLCRAVVTIDYRRRRITVTTPTGFRPPLRADVLPLTIRRGWSFVRGTIKVPGSFPSKTSSSSTRVRWTSSIIRSSENPRVSCGRRERVPVGSASHSPESSVRTNGSGSDTPQLRTRSRHAAPEVRK